MRDYHKKPNKSQIYREGIGFLERMFYIFLGKLLLFRTPVHGNDFETLSSTKYTKYAKILDTPVSSKGSKEPLLPACPPAEKVLTFPAGGQHRKSARLQRVLRDRNDDCSFCVFCVFCVLCG